MGPKATAHFEWGTTTGYGASSAEAPVGSDAGGHAIAAQATGLEANTTYHFRVVATSDVDTTAGADQTFTSSSVPPDVTTGAAGDDRRRRDFGGLVNARNSATTYSFEWGASPEMDNLTEVGDLVVTDNEAHPVSAALTDLEPNTTYSYRLVARSDAGDTYGEERAFTTPIVVHLPVTGSAADVSAIGATLTGTLDPRNAQVTHWFEWGPSIAYDGATPSIALGGAQALIGHPVEARIEGLVHPVEARIESLVPGATYHYRAAAQSAAGTACGEDRAFTATILHRSGRRTRHGQYRTKGLNSVATVRGTVWITTEKCAGTLTTVKQGTVDVLSLRTGRRVLVRAGGSMLARAAR